MYRKIDQRTADSTKRNYTGRWVEHWTDSEYERLKSMISRNMNISDISAALGRTYNSVRHKRQIIISAQKTFKHQLKKTDTNKESQSSDIDDTELLHAILNDTVLVQAILDQASRQEVQSMWLNVSWVKIQRRIEEVNGKVWDHQKDLNTEDVSFFPEIMHTRMTDIIGGRLVIEAGNASSVRIWIRLRFVMKR